MGDRNLKTQKNLTLFLKVDVFRSVSLYLATKQKGRHSILLSSKHIRFSLGFADFLPQGIAIELSNMISHSS